MDKKQKDQNLRERILIVVLTILIVISSCSAVFLYYNNRMLRAGQVKIKQEMNDLKKEAASLKARYDAVVEEQVETPKNIELVPGMILDAEAVSKDADTYFVVKTIEVGDAVYERINGKSYRENNDIGLDQLRYLLVAHYNFNHEIQVGEIIVNAAISEDVLNIFKELFAAEYEINSMYLIDNYWTGEGTSSDTASIQENNTSAFCYRVITGGSSLSNHAYGCAIDINPQQNPYIWYSEDGAQWYHENAAPYVDRTTGDPHVIVEGDVCCDIFKKYGFSWGGNWSNPVDYQHFEKQLY